MKITVTNADDVQVVYELPEKCIKSLNFYVDDFKRSLSICAFRDYVIVARFYKQLRARVCAYLLALLDSGIIDYRCRLDVSFYYFSLLDNYFEVWRGNAN